MPRWDLSPVTHSLYEKRSNLLSRPVISSNTKVAFLGSELGLPFLDTVRENANAAASAGAVAITGGQHLTIDEEGSNTSIEGAASLIADGDRGVGNYPSNGGNRIGNGSSASVNFGRKTPRCRAVCLLRCDAWTGSVVSLASDESRLTLREATLELDALSFSASAESEDDSASATNDRQPSRGSRRTGVNLSYRPNYGFSAKPSHSVCDVDRDGEESDDEPTFRKVYSTQWSLGSDPVREVLLTADGDSTAPASPILSLSRFGGGGAVIALSAQCLHLVEVAGLSGSLSLQSSHCGGGGQRRQEPVSVAPTRSLSFDGRPSVNATVMDAYGPHCTLVGFSNGQLNVYDWRERHSYRAGSEFVDEGTAQRPSLTLAAVPQPLWLLPKGSAAARRRRLGSGSGNASADAATRAGILSCCGLEGNWRVVCGLAEGKGAVVVADLRKGMARSVSSTASTEAPSTSAVTAASDAFLGASLSPLVEKAYSRKRSRMSAAETAVKQLLEGHITVVTGSSITSIQHCAERFGLVGMVDLEGRPVLTSIAALEGGLGGLSNDDIMHAHGVATTAAHGSDASMRSRVVRRPALPSPQDVGQRVRRGGTALQQGALSGGRSSISNRCAFAGCGDFFVYLQRTAGRDGLVTSAASFLSTGLGSRTIDLSTGGMGDGQTLGIRERAALLQQQADPDAFSVTALSSLDDTVCLETQGGHSVCVMLDS